MHGMVRSVGETLFKEMGTFSLKMRTKENTFSVLNS